jgi:asparagine synthase (glutamine-hydrolysing)
VCGILGQVEREARVDADAFARMLETLAARGPDGSGQRLLEDGRVALGHRRLAVIDPSPAAAQPLANEDGRIWLTFNGEIYNFRELRRELQRRGHHFRSEGDSEVIVHAYEEWGDACVRWLRGIFAFGLFDGRRQRLLLARDRLGVKPLYYWAHDGGLVFASQPRAILAHPEFRPQLDLRAFQHYLADRYVPHDLAIYQDMAKLPAAHVLVHDASGTQVRRYWEASYQPRIVDPREAREWIRTRIEDAVQSQLVADVPIGLFLSGGIDSTTVGAVATSASGERLSSFTIGFDDPERDEREYARQAARVLGTEHWEEVLTWERASALLPTFAEIYDEPFFDHSGLPTFALSRLTREHGVKVALAGDGADELFAGYLWYEPPRAAPRWSWRGLRRRAPDPLQVHFRRTGQLGAERQARLLRGAPRFDPLTHRRRFFRPELPPVTALQMVDLHTFLVDDVLVKVDRASMACGVEVRVPLLDHELVEAALSVDASLIFAGGERKALLKRAASAWLPPELLTPRKQGFGAPVRRWMQAGLEAIAGPLLREGSLVGRGVLDADATAEIMSGDRPGEVWLLLAAELWARRWLEGQVPELGSAASQAAGLATASAR